MSDTLAPSIRPSGQVQRLAYSIDEALQAVPIGRTKLYELLDLGRIPSIKVGRRRLITAAALEHFLASGDAA